MKNNKQEGFSLIELFIVIAIIILLATVSIIALNDQRAKARDAKRISDIRQIRTALEFYHSDEDSYPIVEQPVVLGAKGVERLCSSSIGGFVSGQTPCSEGQIYMSVINPDPLAPMNYYYTGIAEGYDIIFTTEKPSALGPAGTYHGHSQVIDTESGNR